MFNQFRPESRISYLTLKEEGPSVNSRISQRIWTQGAAPSPKLKSVEKRVVSPLDLKYRTLIFQLFHSHSLIRILSRLNMKINHDTLHIYVHGTQHRNQDESGGRGHTFSSLKLSLTDDRANLWVLTVSARRPRSPSARTPPSASSAAPIQSQTASG